MSLWLRALVALRNALNVRIHKEIAMPSEYNASVLFACPPAQLPDLKVWMRDNLAIPVDDFDLVLRLGPDGTPYASATHLAGAMTFKAAQIELLRPEVSPEGGLYALGIRARRAFFPPAETTTNQPGKLQVDVIDVGGEIPGGVDWSATRLTKDRFFEELAVVQLEAPEPAI